MIVVRHNDGLALELPWRTLRELQQVVAGNRVWLQPQVSGPVQELPEAMVRSTRLAGWQLATGDWRGEFPQARVLKRIELDGQPVFIVHAAPAKGRQRLIYLDAENGLTLGYDEVFEIPGQGMVGCEVRFADYRAPKVCRFRSRARSSMPHRC